MKINEIVLEDTVKHYTSEKLNVPQAVDILNQYCSDSIALINKPI
jgi:hypothetical protein